jgi:hypothetical protein
MNRIVTYKTPQFHVFLIGLFLIGLGVTIAVGSRTDQPSPVKNNATSSQIQVETSRQQPTSTIQNLQGASNLQSQQKGDLQQPTNAQTLQPNANTDSLSSPAE